jgi:hypothetical protein
MLAQRVHLYLHANLGRLQVDLHFCLRAIAGWFISVMTGVYMVWFWIRGKGSGMFHETP